jgi:parallel beta-helix repeat protein
MNQLNRSSRKIASSAARHARRARMWSALPELLENRQLLSSTYQVTTIADTTTMVNPATYQVGDTLSLHQAIQLADGDTSPDTIQFAMTDGTKISLSAALPTITNQITIDASGQIVELDGTNAGAATNGLDFEAGSAGSTVTGLTINSFGGAGVLLNAGGVTLQGNFIGTDASGSAAKANHDGVVITSNRNSLLGNTISGNSYDGVSVTGDANVLKANKIGTDATGTVAIGNSGLGSFSGSAGVFVQNASNTQIGGPDAADRNIISGNSEAGIVLVNDTGLGNVIEGNYIGLDASGSVALGNFDAGIDLGTPSGLPVANVSILDNVISANAYSGIYLNAVTNSTIQGNLIGTDALGHSTIDSTSLNPAFGNNADGITIDVGSSGNLIGGMTASGRNVIAGNLGNGVGQLGAGAAANLLEGNYIGTDVTGLANAGNQGDGVYIQAGLLTVGGAAAGNVISGNFGYGLDLDGGVTQAYANLIGVAADGVTALGNAGDGVHINNSSGNVLGSSAAAMGNVIAYNGASGPGRGINVVSGTQNAIEGNSIFSNRTLGIDLGGDGVTMNDAAGHSGPNNYQDFPVLASVTGDGTLATVTGSMTGVAGSQYTLDFYDNANADASGYGQGQVYVGSMLVTIGSDGTASFSAKFAQPLASGQSALTQWSVTATDALGNTSEFALDAAETITLPQQQQPSTTTLGSSAEPSTWGQLVTFTAVVTGGASAAPTGTVQFSVDGVAVGGPVTLVHGAATFSTSSLTVTAAAGHTVTAAYSGDANYLTSNASISQDVSRAASSTALSATTLTSTFGQTVTLTAAVSPSINGVVPTGSVMFLDGATLLGTVTLDANGVAALPVNGLSVGGHTITAVYSSDGNYMGSTSNPIAETVSPIGNSISGTVFRDVTGDGLSSDDKTMSGVTVQLLKVNGSSTVVVASVVSGSNGTYTFNNVAAGSYELQEVTPSGFVRTAPTNSAFYTANVTSGAAITGDNFDNYQTGCCDDGSLSHVVYTINGRYRVTDLRGHVHQGDTVSVTFTIDSGYMDTLSLVSYIAPGSSFSANTASQQKIYQDATGTFGPGTYTLSVVVPPCYFQVDFVCGYAIDHFGPAGSNIFYHAQDRLISADNGGTCSATQAHVKC